MSRLTIYKEINDERKRQEDLKLSGRFKFSCADIELSNHECLAVLVEEVGEVARCLLERYGLVNDLHGKYLRKELIQVAAVVTAWIEKLDKEA